MGLFAYTVAGGAFILIGAWETLLSASQTLRKTQNTDSPTTPKTTSFTSTLTFVLISIFSVLFILNSLISLSDAVSSRDSTGLVLQFEVIAIALLFLLYSLLGVLSNIKGSLGFALEIRNLIYAFAFGEEFLLFYTQSKDPSGIENRYYDLLLIPIAVCLFSTVLELRSPGSSYPRLGRGVGLFLQGMWTLQMGFSFFSDLIANGCALHERSRGNYTIRCKGHPEYHRGRAVATLQFNCHLALLVTLGVLVYSFVCRKYGISRDSLRYKPLGDGGEVHLEDGSRFSLVSDDEEDGDGIKEVRSVEMQKANVEFSESAVNGNGAHS